MPISSSSASSLEHWNSVPGRPTADPTQHASALAQELRATRIVVSISSKPNATAIAASAGVAATTSYEKGVAVFILGRGGLMAEASVGGLKFDYSPL